MTVLRRDRWADLFYLRFFGNTFCYGIFVKYSDKLARFRQFSSLSGTNKTSLNIVFSIWWQKIIIIFELNVENLETNEQSEQFILSELVCVKDGFLFISYCSRSHKYPFLTCLSQKNTEIKNNK